MEGEYRDYGVKWTIDEVPVKWARPKKVIYVYDCEQCGKEFKTEYKIHIPHCEACRLEYLNKIRKEW